TLSIEIVTPVTTNTSLYSFSIQHAGINEPGVHQISGEGYDAAGNVIGYTDSVNGTYSFVYDTLNRVAATSSSQSPYPYPNYCWQYDNFGNRLWQTSSATAY